MSNTIEVSVTHKRRQFTNSIDYQQRLSPFYSLNNPELFEQDIYLPPYYQAYAAVNPHQYQYQPPDQKTKSFVHLSNNLSPRTLAIYKTVAPEKQKVQRLPKHIIKLRNQAAMSVNQNQETIKNTNTVLKPTQSIKFHNPFFMVTPIKSIESVRLQSPASNDSSINQEGSLTSQTLRKTNNFETEWPKSYEFYSPQPQLRYRLEQDNRVTSQENLYGSPKVVLKYSDKQKQFHNNPARVQVSFAKFTKEIELKKGLKPQLTLSSPSSTTGVVTMLPKKSSQLDVGFRNTLRSLAAQEGLSPMRLTRKETLLFEQDGEQQKSTTNFASPTALLKPKLKDFRVLISHQNKQSLVTDLSEDLKSIL